MNDAHDFTDRYYDNIISDLKKVTLVASPPFKESRRISYLKKYLNNLGYNDTEIDKEGNLKATLKGKNPKILVFSAHVDTVFPKETQLKIKENKQTIACPGICDNSLGVTALLYLMRYVKENKIIPKYNVIFLFNVGEEGAGNLRGIRHFFDNQKRENIKAHICIEGRNIGRLTKEVVGSHRKNIKITAQGGHSWRDFGNTNAIVVAAEIINKLAAIKLQKEPKTTLNIGTIKGGHSVNSIPSKAEFGVDIRSTDKAKITSVTRKMDGIIKSMTKNNCKIESYLIGERPCGEMKDKWLVNKIKEVHDDLEIKTIDDIGSTDSSYPISLCIPSVTIGITEAKKTHSLDEYLFKSPVRKGIEQLILIYNKIL